MITKKTDLLISERKTRQKALHEWELEAVDGNEKVKNLPLETRIEMETLKEQYIHNPSAKTTLALATFFEKNGLKSLSSTYYDQLFTKYRSAKETRELQGSRNK